MTHERRRNDVFFAEALQKLQQAVSDLSTSAKLQTLELVQHRELSTIHLEMMQKEHDALKNIVLKDLQDTAEMEEKIDARFAEGDERIKSLEKDITFWKGMAKAAAVFWSLCTGLLGVVVWLFNKLAGM